MSITKTQFKSQIADGSRKLYGYLAKNTDDYYRVFGIKRIYKTDLNDCIDRNDWRYNTVYSYYVDSLTAESPKTFYVNTFQNGVHKVFKCLDNHNNSPSTTDPFFITRYEPVRLNDGYVWMLMYQFTDMNYRKFSSDVVIPIVNDPIVTAKARPGIIHNVVVTDGGAGYTTAVVTIIGAHNVEARAIPIIKDGRIDRIDVTDVGVGYLSGATVTIVGNGVGATAIIPTAPINGHGYDAKTELFCDSVAISQYVSDETDYEVIPYGMKYNEYGIIQDAAIEYFKGDYRIRYIDIPNGGDGYDRNEKPVISITGGFDMGQTETVNGAAYAVVTDEKIIAAILTNKGKGYRAEPTVEITHPDGTGVTHVITMESIMMKNLDMIRVINTIGTFAVGEIIIDENRQSEAVITLIDGEYIYLRPITGNFEFSVDTKIQGLSSNAMGDLVLNDPFTRKDYDEPLEENYVITKECHMLTRQEDQPERLHFVIKF